MKNKQKPQRDKSDKSKYYPKPYHNKDKNGGDVDPSMPRKKKAFGQNFLRKHSVVDNMVNRVVITPETTVMEIGCGDGFLTSAILQQSKCKHLECFEIDPEWASFVQKKITDPRLHISLQNILEVDLSSLAQFQPLVLLANLPYQITFPIIFRIQKYKEFFQEGVIMVQEEVAQKIVATHGKGYSSTSLFLQYHFDLQLMEKVEPSAFEPAPKVFSRLLYFKPKLLLKPIPEEEDFWKFLKLCFKSPRQTLRNNLKSTHFSLDKMPEHLPHMRAQQLSFEEFLTVWQSIIDSRV